MLTPDEVVATATAILRNLAADREAIDAEVRRWLDASFGANNWPADDLDHLVDFLGEAHITAAVPTASTPKE